MKLLSKLSAKLHRSGFTVIEVLIVLAISGLLFISAATVFSTKQGQTQFNQAMYDVQSKVQSVAGRVASGSFEDRTGLSCTVAVVGTLTPHVFVSPGSASTGSNQDCLTLGRAIQVIPDSSNSSKLYIFTILGMRNVHPTPDPAMSVAEARPQPIFNHPVFSPNIDFTEVYPLSNIARVVSAKHTGVANFEILGLYLAPQVGSSAGQNSTFTALAYPFNSPAADYTNNLSKTQIQSCLHDAACGSPSDLQKWDLCFQSPDGSQTANLSITSKPGGINTTLKFEDCS